MYDAEELASPNAIHDCDPRSSLTDYRCGLRRADCLEIPKAWFERTKVACDDFNNRASPGNAVGVSVFDVHDIQRRNWWREKWKLDHLAFDKNWKLPFVAGPTCEPNGNQENAVATARCLVFDGVDLVITRDGPVAPGKHPYRTNAFFTATLLDVPHPERKTD